MHQYLTILPLRCVAFEVPNMTTNFMHQYFEVMHALALRTLKSDNFAFEVCSHKHDMISCSVFLTNFSLLV